MAGGTLKAALLFLRRAATGQPGAPTLAAGQPFMNEADGTLWYGAGNDGLNNATSAIAIGGVGLLRSGQAIVDMGQDNLANTNGVFGVGAVTQAAYDLGSMSGTRTAVSDLGLLSDPAGTVTAIDLGLLSA